MLESADPSDELSYPVVYTEHTRYMPEYVTKKSYGVIMIRGGQKKTVPWNRIKSVNERYDA